jgi:hypothetical protein
LYSSSQASAPASARFFNTPFFQRPGGKNGQDAATAETAAAFVESAKQICGRYDEKTRMFKEMGNWRGR